MKRQYTATFALGIISSLLFAACSPAEQKSQFAPAASTPASVAEVK